MSYPLHVIELSLKKTDPSALSLKKTARSARSLLSEEDCSISAKYEEDCSITAQSEEDCSVIGGISTKVGISVKGGMLVPSSLARREKKLRILSIFCIASEEQQKAEANKLSSRHVKDSKWVRDYHTWPKNCILSD